MAQFALCDNETSMKAALSALSKSTILAFDSEGQDLGQVGGKLSFLTLRPIIPGVSTQVYLFDAVKIGREELGPVFSILEDDHVQKVVFDGRMDYSCLFHDYGVRLRNVVDLQLVDIKSRAMRGETFEGQMNRFKRSQVGQAQEQRPHYEKLHKLSGLNQCAKEHGVMSEEDKAPWVNHYSWMTRPATQANLQYAAHDVELIQKVYEKFTSSGYICSGLDEDSFRYVTIWEDGRPQKFDGARNHSILPLNILDHDSTYMKRNCAGCKRVLPSTCFSKNQWRSSSGKCLVCTLALRSLRSNWRDFEYDGGDFDDEIGDDCDWID